MADTTKKMRSLRREMTAWRKTKKTAGGRIPERFWRPAVELARIVGPKKVCQELGLREPQLHKRLHPTRVEPAKVPTFVEMLVAPSRGGVEAQPCSGCIIKVEAVSGARMQVEVGELEPSGLATILREFAN